MSAGNILPMASYRLTNIHYWLRQRAVLACAENDKFPCTQTGREERSYLNTCIVNSHGIRDFERQIASHLKSRLTSRLDPVLSRYRRNARPNASTAIALLHVR